MLVSHPGALLQAVYRSGPMEGEKGCEPLRSAGGIPSSAEGHERTLEEIPPRKGQSTCDDVCSDIPMPVHLRPLQRCTIRTP
jgi:hypothetical protein